MKSLIAIFSLILINSSFVQSWQNPATNGDNVLLTLFPISPTFQMNILKIPGVMIKSGHYKGNQFFRIINRFKKFITRAA